MYFQVFSPNGNYLHTFLAGRSYQEIIFLDLPSGLGNMSATKSLFTSGENSWKCNSFQQGPCWICSLRRHHLLQSFYTVLGQRQWLVKETQRSIVHPLCQSIVNCFSGCFVAPVVDADMQEFLKTRWLYSICYCTLSNLRFLGGVNADHDWSSG